MPNFLDNFVLHGLMQSYPCLSFGADEETTTPNQSQVARSRAEMYINDAVEITPLGYKLPGSGIDDAIWFKFQTDATDLSMDNYPISNI